MEIRLTRAVCARLNKRANEAGCQTVRPGFKATRSISPGSPCFWRIRTAIGEEAVLCEEMDRNNPIWQELNAIARERA